MINQGSVYEGYRLQRALGQGWLGAVHAAQDLDAGDLMALRIIAPEHLGQPQLLAQLSRLIDKVHRLKHPGILEVGRLVETEHRAYYAMTLAQSGSVRQLLQSVAREGQYLDLLVTVELVRQAAAALDFAHRADLMHGNLRPENVLVQPGRALLGRPSYTVQLGDFGVGELRAFTYGTHDRLIVTAPAYMSPEQCRGVRGEQRSDVYALGVVLYELLTGMVPFETRDPADALEKHQHVAPIPPGQIRRDLPEDLEEIVLTCLAKAPEYRYPTAGDLEAALQGVLNRLMPQGPNPTVVLPELPPFGPPPFDPPRDRAKDPRLVILDREGRVLRVETLAGQTTTLGRSGKNDVVLDHPGVSRHHLNVEVEGEKVFVTDLSSTNGTRLDRLKLPAMKRVPWAYGSLLHLEPHWIALIAPQKIAPPARISVSSESTLTLVPGETYSLNVQLANTGRTVDHFMVSVEGVAKEWILNAFHEVQLNPGTRGESALQVRVPRSPEARAGEYPVRVIACSRENPEEVGFSPMTWTVAPFTSTTVDVLPKKRSAWFSTRYELRITNGGNLPVTYSSSVRDDEDALRLESPLSMTRVPTGGDLSHALPWRLMVSTWSRQLREGVGKVRVAPLSQDVLVNPGESYGEPIRVRLPPRWIGTVRRHSLQVGVQSNQDRPGPVTVNLQHNPLLPVWWVPFLLAVGAFGFFWATRPPSIVEFEASPKNPPLGQPFTVRWETHNARRVKLMDQELPAGTDGKGSFTVPGLSEATELKLTAYSRFKNAHKALLVTPKLPAPVIERFEVSSLSAPVGDTVTVRWKVANVKSVTLEPFGTVDASGEAKRKITADMAFRLLASSGGENVVRNVEVKVLAPVIELFKVTPENAEVGQTVTIRWKVAHATSVTIDPLGTVGASGQTQLTAQQNTVYRITAANGQASVSSSGAVSVVARAPRVVAFTVNPVNVKPGERYTLSWQTQDASSVELSGPGGSQSLAASGSVVQRAPGLAAPVTLNLIARNAQGQQDARSVSMLVVAPPEVPVVTKAPIVPPASVPAPVPPPAPAIKAPPVPAQPPTRPEIKLFSVSAREVTKGDKVTLKWQVGGVGKVTLEPLGKSFPAQGSVTVPVSRNTTYILSTGGNDPVQARQVVTLKAVLPAPKPLPAPLPVAAPKPAPKPAPALKPAPAPKSATVSTPTALPTPVTPAPTPAAILSFTASDVNVTAGSSVTLSWNVQHAKEVSISGLGDVEEQGSQDVVVMRSTSYLLRARGEDGKSITKTVRVSAERLAASRSQILPGSAVLNGTWQHSFGRLTLQIDGSDVTGSFMNDRTGEQGAVKGKLIQGGSSAFTLNARILLDNKPEENIAFVVSFNEELNAFFGPYSSRAARERWCGWRPGGTPPAECQGN
ncbi:FHA domain-containing serine/threonine-protein kinase [Deinococcus peraridilitoris]|uniref:Serine/threonine protein kinase n=1 Tax=Deinococcus peraridilitoris (strain DSM 19664 / LMG 22246 / CIP 109416 / KR-200) TaxID=937777 RepID=L0A2W2_DEIPD|nr:FHA domain-containing serine/threonine-protein kinase [Deinococcus peraridilitoris]AFZ67350.1 serine/threonine protein kinase [Deinococcus peraridilitoris DSM 19664]